MNHCLYGREVYDHMLEDSLDICAQLQLNLDNEIDRVRSEEDSSSASTSQIHNGGGNYRHRDATQRAAKERVRFVEDGKDAANGEEQGEEHRVSPSENKQPQTAPTLNNGSDETSPKKEKSSWFSSAKKRPAVTVKNVKKIKP